MVTFLEELYATSDVRPQIESTFKLVDLMKKHGKVVARKKSDKNTLIQSAIADQTMNNASEFMR
jgi:hypothetical protein